MQTVFQPIWDLNHAAILGYEALARPAAVYGFIGPQEAFDVADSIGRTHELDLVCLRSAIAGAKRLPAGSLLFLNVSPKSLDHEFLAGTNFVDELRMGGLTPDRIVIEITERAVMPTGVIVREAVRLQKLGFRISLDDCGAGNNGLDLLSKLRVDYIKIDRSLLVQAVNERVARSVLAGVIAIAREMESYLIAEGIDDLELLAFARTASALSDLARGGISGVQGFLLGEPDALMTDSEMVDPNELLEGLLEPGIFRHAV